MQRHKRLRVKALLIDLDGTLVDSTDAYREAGKAGFAAIGLANFNDESIAFEVARRLEQNLSIDDLFTAFENGAAEERYLPAYLEAYYSMVHIKSKLFPNAKETLKRLSRDLKLALITSRYILQERIVEELSRLRLSRYFSAVVTTLDVEKPKPFPDALLTAAQRLNMRIQDCAIVGDSVVDVQAGKAAGAKTIVVLSGLFTRGDLKKQKPDLIIKDISSLPDYVQSAGINT